MTELEQVAEALDRQDYRQAAKLLKQLQQQAPQNPWVQLYAGRWYEGTDKLETAEKVYRKLLKDATNPKIVAQARQGLQRIETLEQNRRQQAIVNAKTDPSNTEPGVLILEPLASEHKQNAAKTLARMLKTDPYTARMQLQSRGWRLYKTGEMGELKVYGQEMLEAGIPVFWVALTDIQNLHVFRVQSIQSLSPQPTIICQNEQDQLGSLTFSWQEVSQRVEGLLPLFIEMFDYDPRRRKSDRFRHKEMTQDYAQILDLHLPKRRCILRFCDHSYNFQDGIDFSQFSQETQDLPQSQNTTRINWNLLTEQLNQALTQTQLWSEFTPFAETTLDYTQLLGRLIPYIDVPRKSESLWDNAFHLYSGLVFFKQL
ncbi:tetratricopeptide repeat protein [Planktothrix mougeotii]|uniref:Tetratricopeptide repeat protein n=1 Tax=Planktothrix mougeotii LEGE 06226 TaxID=1828728 RepID=A0ABR9UFY5_9CYAN|nr:tetratricopeptide repeat protein [Planktothrix mougeotii]MBE9145383.1 tetratricopeptide repeat protein [Planktothrix mougeotii LEGE 06226]